MNRQIKFRAWIKDKLNEPYMADVEGWEKELDRLWENELFTPTPSKFPYQKSRVKSFIHSLLLHHEQKIRKEMVEKILARLAVEIMEVEVQKSEDDYIEGHIHGVKRSIYLIREIVENLPRLLKKEIER